MSSKELYDIFVEYCKKEKIKDENLIFVLERFYELLEHIKQ